MQSTQQPSAIDRQFYERDHNLARAMNNLVDRGTPSAIKSIPGWQEFLMVTVLASQAMYETVIYLSRDSGSRDDLMPKQAYGVMELPPLNRTRGGG